MTDKPFSKLKPAEKFQAIWDLEGYQGSDLVLEHKFSPDRKWRFDFAWPSLWVAVEIDGFGWGHQAQQNLAKQHEKQNEAIELGWKVLRYNSRQLGSRQGVSDAVHQVCRVLEVSAKLRKTFNDASLIHDFQLRAE